MGMFDTIYLTIKCPNCGITHEVDVQTKQLEQQLNEYRKGDKIKDNKIETLYCIGECQSKWHSGDPFFDIKLKVKNGIITGEYEIIKHEL